MSEISDLIPPLYKATMDHKVSWTMDGPSTITTLQGASFIEIVNTNQGFRLAVRNEDGVVLDSRLFSGSGEMIEMVHKIFRQAKRDSLGVDRVLDDLKNALMKL